MSESQSNALRELRGAFLVGLVPYLVLLSNRQELITWIGLPARVREVAPRAEFEAYFRELSPQLVQKLIEKDPTEPFDGWEEEDSVDVGEGAAPQGGGPIYTFTETECVCFDLEWPERRSYKFQLLPFKSFHEGDCRIYRISGEFFTEHKLSRPFFLVADLGGDAPAQTAVWFSRDDDLGPLAQGGLRPWTVFYSGRSSRSRLPWNTRTAVAAIQRDLGLDVKPWAESSDEIRAAYDRLGERRINFFGAEFEARVYVYLFFAFLAASGLTLAGPMIVLHRNAVRVHSSSWMLALPLAGVRFGGALNAGLLCLSLAWSLLPVAVGWYLFGDASIESVLGSLWPMIPACITLASVAYALASVQLFCLRRASSLKK